MEKGLTSKAGWGTPCLQALRTSLVLFLCRIHRRQGSKN